MIAFAQALGDYNWTSHAIWLVGWLGLAVVVLIAVVEFVSWLREKISNRLRGFEPSGVDPLDFQLRDPSSELRDRYYTDPPKIGRDQRANEPAKRSRRLP